MPNCPVCNHEITKDQEVTEIPGSIAWYLNSLADDEIAEKAEDATTVHTVHELCGPIVVAAIAQHPGRMLDWIDSPVGMLVPEK